MEGGRGWGGGGFACEPGEYAGTDAAGDDQGDDDELAEDGEEEGEGEGGAAAEDATPGLLVIDGSRHAAADALGEAGGAHQSGEDGGGGDEDADPLEKRRSDVGDDEADGDGDDGEEEADEGGDDGAGVAVFAFSDVIGEERCGDEPVAEEDEVKGDC